ncbi:hypothetical protein TL16_g00971 [Triparma laevis f. inornata]|uniref:Uncharacterized protein n=1 Tax=Triparma laevis f. inornata TaxID=1714386 RepID=A0A9W7DQ83_9STRA|nr:hypothetical protein TL16_g00971 [Triparma laevis f. inornata]
MKKVCRYALFINAKNAPTKKSKVAPKTGVQVFNNDITVLPKVPLAKSKNRIKFRPMRGRKILIVKYNPPTY